MSKYSVAFLLIENEALNRRERKVMICPRSTVHCPPMLRNSRTHSLRPLRKTLCPLRLEKQTVKTKLTFVSLLNLNKNRFCKDIFCGIDPEPASPRYLSDDRYSPFL